jgi:putative peptidoglycan lipid II flippase
MRLPAALASIAGFNILLGFAFQWYVVTALGAGRQTDALLAGMLIPQLALGVVSASLMHVLVPLFSAAPDEEPRRDSWTIFSGVGLVFGGAAVALGLTAELWVPFLVPGFEADAVALSISLTRIQLVGMVFSVLSAVLSALSHARRQFIRVELATTIASLAGIALLVGYLERIGPHAAAWGFSLRPAVQVVLLCSGLGTFRAADWGRSTLMEAWRRIRPLLLGSLYHKSDVFVDRYLASMAPAGGMTLLGLAQQLYTAGHSVLDKAISAPVAPLLAQRARAGRWDDFRRMYMRRVRAVFAFAFSSYALLLVAGEPLLRLLIGYGNIGGADVHALWMLLALSGGVWLLAPPGRIMSMTFYATGNTRTPTIVGAIAFTVSIPLRVALFATFGLRGLAAAMSLHYLTAFLLLIFAMRGAPASRVVAPVASSV